MKDFLNEYMKEVTLPFNKEFITSRGDDKLLTEVKEAFHILTQLEDIDLNEDDITLNSDESTFGPIRFENAFYKAVEQSRLNKINFKLKIKNSTKTINKDIYVNKLVDNCFYINKGQRCFLIWQIVESTTFAFRNGVTFKTNSNPITVRTPFTFEAIAEFGKSVKTLNVFDVNVFNGKLSAFAYFMMTLSLEVLEEENRLDNVDNVRDYLDFRSTKLIDKFCEFIGVDIKFADNVEDLFEEGKEKLYYQVKHKKDTGIYFSIDEDVANTELGEAVISMLLYVKIQEKKSSKKNALVYTYDDVINPSFWIKIIGDVFVNSPDPLKRLMKIKDVNRSLGRLLTDRLRDRTPIEDRHKENTRAVIRYLITNYKEISSSNSQDLDSKRIRLYEYMLYPLYNYFSTKVNTINNMSAKTVKDVEDIFNGLSSMYIVKNSITSELLRYFNSTNEMNLFGAMLKYTFRGPQGYVGSVSEEHRSLHPSYIGRISLTNSAAGDPGVTGTLVPYIEVFDSFLTQASLDKIKK